MAEFRGIDVSAVQGTIDWARVKSSGLVDFAILRSGYGWSYAPGRQADRFFTANVEGCEKHGIPYGIYHYSYCVRPENARREARYFLDIIRDARPVYPVFMDIEDPSQAKLPRAVLTQIAYDFCDEVERAGYYTAIYSYKNFLETHLDMAALARVDVWVAQIASENSYRGPHGMWQYSWTGSIPGIRGDVDLDIAYRNYPAIIRRAGLNKSADGTAAAIGSPDPSNLSEPPRRSPRLGD